MQYRSIADLAELIRTNLTLIPHDVDLVVGIPRSGMLPASIIALYLNKRLVDIDGFIAGRYFCSGERSKYISEGKIEKVLIVDDSVCLGNAITAAKEKLSVVEQKYDLIYLAPIVTSSSKCLVDIYFEVVDDIRFFEWNIFHHANLRRACFDIDGVLNADPQTDDDGEQYKQFLNTAAPKFIPTAPIHSLITCRLSKYRRETENWLKKYNIQYKHLIMLDFPTKSDRIKWGKHGEYKAEYYRANDDLILFVESSKKQADIIAMVSHKPVFCIETNSLIYIPLTEKITLLKKIKRKLKNRFPELYVFLQKVSGRK